MDIKVAKLKYQLHKGRAKYRGIGFELTFEEWLEIWGNNLDRCGVHRDQLGMCRIMDTGPYKVGNVFLGTPKRNGHTRQLVTAEKVMTRLKEEIRAEINPPKDEVEENPWLPDELQDGIKTSWGWGHVKY